jgi:hypothetical protein
MVDTAINWLFVDLNSYFASIEQELRPELRGQPIAIVPIRVEAQTGLLYRRQLPGQGLGRQNRLRESALKRSAYSLKRLRSTAPRTPAWNQPRKMSSTRLATRNQ